MPTGNAPSVKIGFSPVVPRRVQADRAEHRPLAVRHADNRSEPGSLAGEFLSAVVALAPAAVESDQPERKWVKSCDATEGRDNGR